MFFTLLSADELLPLLLPVCGSDWTQGAVCGLWLHRQSAHIDWFDDHLPVHLLSLQRGDGGCLITRLP